MKYNIVSVLLAVAALACTSGAPEKVAAAVENTPKSTPESAPVRTEAAAPRKPMEAVIEKDLLYDKYTLEDTYTYGKVQRSFQWDKMRPVLVYIDSIQISPSRWGVLQNYKTVNGKAPLVGSYSRNEYKRIEDDYGIERYQSAPLYNLDDTLTPVRYGHDGHLMRIIDRKAGSKFVTVENVNFPGRWLVPSKYLKEIDIEGLAFRHVVIPDRTNQNITTFEKSGDKWLVRSMNPCTTGAHNPPVQMETPLGIFVIQEKKPKMLYMNDSGSALGGYSPWASRFCNGGYLHGVPVNLPRTEEIEFGATLGTIPRSHMCVRNATSHAKFIYDWAPTLQSLVVVIE